MSTSTPCAADKKWVTVNGQSVEVLYRGDPPNGQYDISNEKHMEHDLMQACLDQKISKFYVEFRVNPKRPKPHVTFRFKLAQVYNGGEKGIEALRLSGQLAYQGAVDHSVEGFCRLQLLYFPVIDGGEAPTTVFEFKWTDGSRTLRDVVELVNSGLQKYNSSDKDFHGQLAGFNYERFGPTKITDGCRDWVTQVFIRMHRLGWVEWQISGIVMLGNTPVHVTNARKLKSCVKPNQDQSLGIPIAIDWSSTVEFQDIISKHFLRAGDVYYYHEKRLGDGKFQDDELIRHRTYEGRVLPYIAS